jgi:hypothetical protein
MLLSNGAFFASTSILLHPHGCSHTTTTNEMHEWLDTRSIFLVNGKWSSWREWSRCSSSCDSGVRQRKRTCDNPKPSDDGLPCYGRDTDYIACVMPNVCEGMI